MSGKRKIDIAANIADFDMLTLDTVVCAQKIKQEWIIPLPDHTLTTTPACTTVTTVTVVRIVLCSAMIHNHSIT